MRVYNLYRSVLQNKHVILGTGITTLRPLFTVACIVFLYFSRFRLARIR